MAHSRETEHYQLPLYDGTDIINPLTDFNNANEKIDEAVYDANQRSVEAKQIAQGAQSEVSEYDVRVSQAEADAEAAIIKAENTQKMMADPFDPLKEGGYKVDDIVLYDGKLYQFINTHTGAWDASDVKESVIGDALEGVIEGAKEDIAEEVAEALVVIDAQTEKVTKTQAMIAEPFDAEKEGGYLAGQIVTYADKLYKFTSDHFGVWTGLDAEAIDVIKEIDSKASSLQTHIDDVENSLLSDIATVESNFNNKLNTQKNNIAPTFNHLKEGGYDAGEVVIYEDNLFRFNAHHYGEWTGEDVETIDVEEQITEMKQSFQNGVDVIYDAEVAQNVSGVPTASTPIALASGVGAIATAKYNSGYSAGETAGLKSEHTIRLSIAVTLPSRTEQGGLTLVNSSTQKIKRVKFNTALSAVRIAYYVSGVASYIHDGAVSAGQTFTFSNTSASGMSIQAYGTASVSFNDTFDVTFQPV